MSFEAPWRLLVGAVIAVILVLLYRNGEARMDGQALRYSNLDFLASVLRRRRWIASALRAGLIAALSALVVGVSGPRLNLPVPVADGYVFICIDTSGSMASTDVAPTRAAAAANAARAFIDEAPQGVRIGIISFSGDAELVEPLSADKNATLAALARIPPPSGATAIGDALRLAETQFPPAGHRVVILVTDGVSNTGVDPQAMADDLGAHHIPVFTIGIGTPNGDVIGGEESTIDENALQSYAQSSGGAYARAENATDLRDALERLGHETAIDVRPVSMGAQFLLAGALILIATLIGGVSMGRVP
jgi:Ca-activated chloride channel homolog